MPKTVITGPAGASTATVNDQTEGTHAVVKTGRRASEGGK